MILKVKRCHFLYRHMEGTYSSRIASASKQAFAANQTQCVCLKPFSNMLHGRIFKHKIGGNGCCGMVDQRKALEAVEVNSCNQLCFVGFVFEV